MRRGEAEPGPGRRGAESGKHGITLVEGDGHYRVELWREAKPSRGPGGLPRSGESGKYGITLVEGDGHHPRRTVRRGEAEPGPERPEAEGGKHGTTMVVGMGHHRVAAAQNAKPRFRTVQGFLLNDDGDV